MKESQIYAYAIGHFLNDLTATVWMTYFVIYLVDVYPIDPASALISSA